MAGHVKTMKSEYFVKKVNLSEIKCQSSIGEAAWEMEG